MNLETNNQSIIQNFVDIQEVYTIRHQTNENFSTVKFWLMQIKYSGYSKKMMHKVIHYILQLKEKSRYTEAAQLLLVSAATHDALALHVLARELVFGVLFEKNEAAAFGILTNLSEKEYPEVLCDLAYFYQHGIVIQKDKKQARRYYEKAASLGVTRAKKYIN